MNLLLIIVGVLLNAGAQVCVRLGMLQIGGIKSIGGLWESIPKMLGNFWIWTATLCYIFSAVIWMVVLSRVEVGYAYCFIRDSGLIPRGLPRLLKNKVNKNGGIKPDGMKNFLSKNLR